MFDNKANICNIVQIMNKTNKTNKPNNMAQLDFIDTTVHSFVHSVQEFSESAQNFERLVKLETSASSSSISDWLTILQSRLTLMKKDYSKLQLTILKNRK